MADVHTTHCFQGEYEGSCKYNDDDCTMIGKVLCDSCHGYGDMTVLVPLEEVVCPKCKGRGCFDELPEIETITLNKEDWDRFVDAIENPKPPTQALIDAIKKYRNK